MTCAQDESLYSEDTARFTSAEELIGEHKEAKPPVVEPVFVKAEKTWLKLNHGERFVIDEENKETLVLTPFAWYHRFTCCGTGGGAPSAARDPLNGEIYNRTGNVAVSGFTKYTAKVVDYIPHGYRINKEAL